jgi:hypothetical protein
LTEPPQIVWDGWPQLDIYLPDTPVSGSISPQMMEAFIELQRSVYKTHALLSTGRDDTRTLKKIEREQFEFRVKVKEGSSGYTVDLGPILSKLGNDIITKMDGQELVITVLGLALIYGSYLMFRAYLSQKTEQKRIETDDAKSKMFLENYKSQLEHDTKRFDLLTKVISEIPVLKQVEEATDVAKDQILKAVADERGGRVMDVELSSEFANQISTTRRHSSIETTIQGLYRVAKVDTTVPDGFRVTLEDIKSGDTITASLIDAIVSAEHRVALQTGEWDKKPVFVEMKGRRLRGRIVDAVIVSVREPKPA